MSGEAAYVVAAVVPTIVGFGSRAKMAIVYLRWLLARRARGRPR